MDPAHPERQKLLPIFTSVKTAEADRGTAARPMVELLLVDAMQKVLDSKEMDGIVLDPWTTSATLDASQPAQRPAPRQPGHR